MCSLIAQVLLERWCGARQEKEDCRQVGRESSTGEEEKGGKTEEEHSAGVETVGENQHIGECSPQKCSVENIRVGSGDRAGIHGYLGRRPEMRVGY